jgi:hypothetical protein
MTSPPASWAAMAARNPAAPVPMTSTVAARDRITSFPAALLGSSGHLLAVSAD